MICPDCGGTGEFYDSRWEEDETGEGSFEDFSYPCETCQGTGEDPPGAPETDDGDVL